MSRHDVSGTEAGMPFSVDIELTNRCNAKCHFCPRDQTPHEGLMSPEVFDQSLARAIEYRGGRAASCSTRPVRISLCGLGEPLLNRHAPDVASARCATPASRSRSRRNGSLLDERRGQALLDAGPAEDPHQRRRRGRRVRGASTSCRSRRPATTSCASRRWPKAAARSTSCSSTTTAIPSTSSR